MIAVVCGGVGAAKFLTGLVRVVDPAEVTAIVNVADDTWLHGLRVCPDLDTVTYTLAGEVNPQTGWGRAGETWAVMDALEALGSVAPDGSSAGLTWFRLGDRDLATHLYRTQRLREGAALSTATAELARAFGLEVSLLPVSDDEVATRVRVLDPDGPSDGVEVDFQEYFVHRRHDVAVAAVRFDGVERAGPAPGVLEALAAAEVVVVAPSNPVVSIGPVVAVAGVGDALAHRRESVVAVSPLVGGRALKGPADRLLADLGHGTGVAAVADLYGELAATLVIDDTDAAEAATVEARGMRAVTAASVMHDAEAAARLAEAVLEAARSAR